MVVCQNCGYVSEQKFCSNCGQPMQVHRIDIRHLLHEVAHTFWHLEKGISLHEFLSDFPSVSRQQSEAVIEWAARRFSAPETITDETPIG